ncbi:hypothetical protein QQS21_010279 [Conoideocrella luteorostrata]|uniref:Transcription factor domain-containing protein n=1 Tax=Conoideocrella luteorostrata TaxID=1105319 RepID=A0AAJ0CHM1_9HYPO|nr:hypothetical protein QQS21_010279 [Conoideocrella luteorostrata]
MNGGVLRSAPSNGLCGCLDVVSHTWSPSAIPLARDFNICLYGNNEYGREDGGQMFNVTNPKHFQIDGFTPSIWQTPVHWPTVLIEHWFRYICPLWSAYDSEVSYIRQLSWSSWSTSGALFNTMQAMSAACLIVDTECPHNVLSLLRLQALAAINEEVDRVRRSKFPPRITSELVYAVFMLGNILPRTPSYPSETTWLDLAHELLLIWKAELSGLDVLLYAYFCQALTYWEMLLASTGRGSVPCQLAKKRRSYNGQLHQALCLAACDSDLLAANRNDSSKPEENLLGTRPNSWCGISSEVIDVFGQALALCHSACQKNKQKRVLTTRAAGEMFFDISLAQLLQKELLAMDFANLLSVEEMHGFPIDTRDNNSPTSHLFLTAKAYRLAALLQLHLAFSDLSLKTDDDFFDDDLSTATAEKKPSRANFLLWQALCLVDILEQIPALSGSKSIHLMLYLSAAVGLKFGTVHTGGQKTRSANLDRSSQYGAEPRLDSSNVEVNLFLGDRSTLVELPATPSNTSDSKGVAVIPFPLSKLVVTSARSRVLMRLGSLRNTLPHRRIDSTLEFVQRIWKVYDDEDDTSACRDLIYWLDVMAEAGMNITLW